MTRTPGAVTGFALWIAITTACTSGNQNFDNGEDGVGNNRPRSNSADGAVDASPPTETETAPASQADTDASTDPDGVMTSPVARNDSGVQAPSDSTEDASPTYESEASADPICGDGVVTNDEECDDGNQIESDDCSNVCMRGYCGDGIVQEFEACDDGDGPDSMCPGCTYDAGWMDGVVNDWEECDDGASPDTDSCIAYQGEWARCGDGYRYTTITDPLNPNPLEECDDGNQIDYDACSNTCTLPYCGDGIVQDGEACDEGDGNGPNGSCPNGCVWDGGWMDGVIDPGEECDDGNSDENDSCHAANATWADCGDGYVYTTWSDSKNPNPLEECDDGIENGGDHCSVACKLVHPIDDAGVDAGPDAGSDAIVPSAN